MGKYELCSGRSTIHQGTSGYDDESATWEVQHVQNDITSQVLLLPFDGNGEKCEHGRKHEDGQHVVEK